MEGFDGAKATAPMVSVGWSSISGNHDVPLLFVRHTPPPAVAAITVLPFVGWTESCVTRPMPPKPAAGNGPAEAQRVQRGARMMIASRIAGLISAVPILALNSRATDLRRSSALIAFPSLCSPRHWRATVSSAARFFGSRGSAYA
jgi:hypothetical protein